MNYIFLLVVLFLLCGTPQYDALSSCSIPILNVSTLSLPFEPETVEGYAMLGFSPSLSMLVIRRSVEPASSSSFSPSSPRPALPTTPSFLYTFDQHLQLVGSANLSAAQPLGSLALTGLFQQDVLFSISDNAVSFDVLGSRLLASSANTLSPSWLPLFAWTDASGARLYAALSSRRGDRAAYVSIDAATLSISAPLYPAFPDGTPLAPLFLGPCLASPLPSLSFCLSVPDSTQPSSLVLLNTSSAVVAASSLANGTQYLAVSAAAQGPAAAYLFGGVGALGLEPSEVVLSAHDAQTRLLWQLPMGRGQAAGMVNTPQLDQGDVLLVSVLEFSSMPAHRQKFYLVDGKKGAVLGCFDTSALFGDKSITILFGSGTPAPFYWDEKTQTASFQSLMLTKKDEQTVVDLIQLTFPLN